MNNPVITKTKPKTPPVSLNWQDNASIQKLLDIVVSIMAEEYVQTARENKDIFTDLSTSCPSGTSLGITDEGGTG